MEKRIVKTENISFKLAEIPLTRKELRNILNYRIPCLCCGHEMIHPDTYTELIENPLLASNALTVIPVLEPYEKIMYPVERQVFNMPKNLSVKHPD